MSNIGIGADIVEVKRFEQYRDHVFLVFLKKNFTEAELEYCLSKDAPAQHLAARFAGKEAVLKALYCLGLTTIFYPAIEILNTGRGVPYVRINTDQAEKLSIRISLSHTADMAMAFCIIIQETPDGII